MEIPLTTFSFIVFFLTVGVGYVILMWSYDSANRIKDWYNMDAFDKTMQTFVVGGFITFASFIVLRAPLSLLTTSNEVSTNQFVNWLWINSKGFLIVELIVILLVWIVAQDMLTLENNDIYDYHY